MSGSTFHWTYARPPARQARRPDSGHTFQLRAGSTKTRKCLAHPSGRYGGAVQRCPSPYSDWPSAVLIIGGGGGALQEVMMKHRTIERVTLVDIDPAVIDAIRKHLALIHKGAFGIHEASSR